MNDKPVILVGLLVGLGVLTFPFWYTLSAARTAGPPDLELPVGRPHCVEDVSYMKAHHMELLEQWREAVVREGKCRYASKTYGESYTMSLTKTCLDCHSSRERFCDRCHDYMNVQSSRLFPLVASGDGKSASVGCWDCHNVPKEK